MEISIDVDANKRGSLPKEFKALQQFKRASALAMQEETDPSRSEVRLDIKSAPPDDGSTTAQASNNLVEVETRLPPAATTSSPSQTTLTLAEAQAALEARKKAVGITAGPTSTSDAIPKAKEADKWKGENTIQYGLWAHYLAYCASLLCFIFGCYAVSWDSGFTPFKCTINGHPLSAKYLPDPSNGKCNITYSGIENNHVQTEDVCCRGNEASTLHGDTPVGAAYMLWSVFLVVSEDTTLGWGLLYPNDTIGYKYKFSVLAILHFILGLAGLSSYSTCLPGVSLIICAIAYQYTASRRECGDGGRRARALAGLTKLDKMLAENEGENASVKNTIMAAVLLIRETLQEYLSFLPECKLVDPRAFCLRIYNEDKLSSYFWVTVFWLINAIIFFSTLQQWQVIVAASKAALIAGTLDVTCDSNTCAYNRQLIKSGPMSAAAPWAKACGMCLNFDCSLLIIPVIKMVLRRLNNAGESLATAQTTTDYCSKFLARPITRYIPIQRNIEFHKVIAFSVMFFSIGHVAAHLANLRYADDTTLQFFSQWGWAGTAYLTGAVVTIAMLIIFSGASNRMRQTKYEIFFQAHHFFLVFYFFMFLHGPNFIYWSLVPCLLYVIERYLQVWRGNQPILVTKVEWISPVMALYFRPAIRDSFTFKEGQYIYLNCPYISSTEWHPFTISSSLEDLTCGTRVCLTTGEDVMPVPRPADLPPKAKWNKFYPVSQDWRTMDPNDYLEQAETDYNDYLSVHIRVHGLDELEAKSWTRKLKEYFQVLGGGSIKAVKAGADNANSSAAAAAKSDGANFPCFFTRREARGDVLMGRMTGPDGTQILRVDGPHSAPAEHYANYGTVMLIGAGIGLTPCASILQALSKYRWKRNFNPEILHFYWMVRQSEVDGYEWFVHMLTELSFEMKKAREAGQVDSRYYLEINIYITGVDKAPRTPPPFHRPPKKLGAADDTGSQPYFTAEELYQLLLNPPTAAKKQLETIRSCKRFTAAADPERRAHANHSPNRLQDIFVYNGRPEWPDIFSEMRASRQTADIGVCYCGPAAVGADLAAMCEKHSSVSDDVLFSLHKENF